MYRDRVKKSTYEELEEELLNPKLIVLNRPIKIPRFNMIENVNDVDFNDFDLDNHNIKTMLNSKQSLVSNHDKSTQQDYEFQNHDLFPEMYEEIDATASVMGNRDATPETRKLREMRTQTKRFTPKGFDLYSSANSSSGKPSSPPSPHHISRPTSSESSEQEAEKKKGFGFFNSREWNMYRRLSNNENRNTTTQNQSSSSSSSVASSALPSNVNYLTQQQMARSRSHSSQSSGSGNKK